MKHLLVLIWGFLAIFGAVALARVTGLVNPYEKVNGLFRVVVVG